MLLLFMLTLYFAHIFTAITALQEKAKNDIVTILTFTYIYKKQSMLKKFNIITFFHFSIKNHRTNNRICCRCHCSQPKQPSVFTQVPIMLWQQPKLSLSQGCFSFRKAYEIHPFRNCVPFNLKDKKRYVKGHKNLLADLKSL